MKALVVYGTRWGGTVAVASKIGEALKKEGLDTDVADVKLSPKTLSSYDLVIVGSGIRADKWTDEITSFLEANAELLMAKKTALFVSCHMFDSEKEARDKAKISYLDKTAEKYGLKPVGLGFFGGIMDFKQSHGLFVDILVRVNRSKLRRQGLDTAKVTDTRDWSSIEAWASQVAKSCR